MTREQSDILTRIVRQRRRSLAIQVRDPGTGPSSSAPLPDIRLAPEHPFLNALRRATGPAVIAEVKMGSPRLGSLADRIDPVEQAQIYADNGAAALSVVVEPDFFFGSYELLARCRSRSGLPTLAKDFVVDPVQLEWARQAGADAVLLIAALYGPAQLVSLAARARALGLAPLVEIHQRQDLDSLGVGTWELVGINNRDLRSFEVSLERSIDLLSSLPRDSLKVAESGIRSAADVEKLASAGFQAFLIGESLLLAERPAAKLRDLLSRAGEPRPS
jgi:indole-3-glycerol phosphate synthase